MAIIISDEAKKLLKDKNKNYILVSLFKQTCWGGKVTKVIEVSIASKFNKELYSKYVVDGIDVEIGVGKFLFKKYFNQVGITAL